MENKKSAIDAAYLIGEIPDALENLQLPDPELRQFYRNYKNRILWVDVEISELSLKYAKMIMQWNFEDKQNGIPKEKRVPIKLLFFSPGGDLMVNNSLIDTITLSETKVIGINAGEASSSGCFIYLACHERYTFPNATFLIHKGSGRFEGDYDELMSALANYQRQIEYIGDYVLSRTEIPEDVFNENFTTDWYLSADEAIKYHVADKIITSLDEIIE